MKLLFNFLLAFFIAHATIAQELDTSKLNTYFKNLEDNQKFMGSVALSKHGKIIYTHSSGFADIKKEIKATDNTVYDIGSVSKTFTAVLVMKAIEENKLRLNQKLSDFFPQVENAEKITIEELLQHRSGIHNFTNNSDYLTYNTEAKSPQEMLEIITEKGSDFEPGSQFQYSNSNYVLLSYILEDVLNTPYNSLLQTLIAKPLKLENTYFGKTIDSTIIQSKSYKMIDKWAIQPETDPSIPMGAGGIFSTPTDLIKFTHALFHGNIVKQESLEKMMTFKDGYGFGLFEIDYDTIKGIGHTGGIDGFRSVLVHYPKHDINLTICSNGEDFSSNKIKNILLNAAFGKDFEIPEFKTVTVSVAELKRYIGFYTSKQIPLDLTITRKGKTLIAQGSGQPSFPLKAEGDRKFTYEAVGLEIQFQPKKNQLILKQNGKNFTFEKDE